MIEGSCKCDPKLVYHFSVIVTVRHNLNFKPFFFYYGVHLFKYILKVFCTILLFPPEQYGDLVLQRIEAIPKVTRCPEWPEVKVRHGVILNGMVFVAVQFWVLDTKCSNRVIGFTQICTRFDLSCSSASNIDQSIHGTDDRVAGLIPGVDDVWTMAERIFLRHEVGHVSQGIQIEGRVMEW